MLSWLGVGLGEPAPQTFACGDGSLIPRSFVGDDYCDCADGLDEATTGACPDTKFTCTNKPHRALDVFVSRVNDGICDCCDGSDEWHQPALCANTCLGLARADLAVFERASQRKEELVRDAQKAAVRRKSRIGLARAELEVADPTLRELQAAQAAAEVREAERRADRESRLAGGEIERALRLDKLTAPLLAQAIARLALAQGVTGVDKLHDYLSANEATAGARAAPPLRRPHAVAAPSPRRRATPLRRASIPPAALALSGAAPPPSRQAMGDVDSADLLELAMDARDAVGAASGGSSPSGAAADAQTCAAHEACGAAAVFEAPLLELLPLGSLPEPTLRALLKGFNEQTEQTALLLQVAQALLAGTDAAFEASEAAAALELLEEFKDAEADAARAALGAHEAKSAGARKQLEADEPVAALERQFGAQLEWAHLHGRCFELRTDLSVGKFNFKLCPFGAFTQDGHSLGTFAGWRPLPDGAAQAAKQEDRLVYEAELMAFEGGDECDGVPRRASVLFECGQEDALTAVAEPQTCVYSAWFTSPSACDADDLRWRLLKLNEAAS